MRAFGFVILAGVVAAACGEEDNRQPPDTAIDTQPAALTNQARATFVFRAIGVSNSFICSIDGAQSNCVPPAIFDNLADGEHTFTVAAAFNQIVDETPATFTWRIDTAAPETTLLTAPPAVDNDTTPELTFEGADAEGAVTFECVFDGDAAPCTSPFTATVVDGAHTFSVTAIDAAGNRDGSPATHAWNVDTATPDTVIDDGPAPGATTATAVTFAFSSPDATATFECATDGATFTACASPVSLAGLADGNHDFAVRAVGTNGPDPSPATRAWIVDAIAPPASITSTPADPSNDPAPAFAFTSTDATATFECQIDGVVAFAPCTSPFTSPALADGNRTFRVRATDPVGNVGTPATFAWTVDTLAPTVTINAQPAAISSDATPTVTFTTGGAPITTTCRVDAGTAIACTSPFTAAAVADGSHTITITVTDAATNSASATTSAFTVDTVTPTVTITSQPGALTNDNTPSVAFTVTDAPTSITCQLDAGTPIACTSPFTFATVADGNHRITVRVADAANNNSSAQTAQFAVDTAAPTVSITAAPASLSNDDTPSVTFTTTGNPTTITCQLDAGTPVACTSPFAFGVTTDGAHTITVRVVDGANNASIDTTPSFTIDTVAPTVTINSEPAALSNDTTPTVTFTTAGNPTSTQCRVDAGGFVNCAGGTFTPTVTANGPHTITVRVTDGATNTSSATTASFTIDTVAPTVTLQVQPAALSSDTTPTLTFTTAGNPTATDCQVDAGAFAPCASPFTATVTDGAHTITVRVTDGANNSSSATTASFTVDTVAPTVTINSQPSANSNDNTPTVTFTTAGNPTTTQCRVDTGTLVNCTNSFTPTVLDGTHTITIVVTDGANNSSSATTASFIVDTVTPSVTITSSPNALSNDNTPSVGFSVTDSPTTIQCRVDAGTFQTCAPPAFTFGATADGTHTITVRVADGAGNASTATTPSFTIDTLPPSVTFVDTPPAQWPVNYFDILFQSPESGVTFTCAVDGAAPTTCTSPLKLSGLTYAGHSVAVRVRDGANNTSAPITTSWTSTTGEVLHYPWEQGSTANTSLLRQNAAYSPSGTASGAFVGGWAGTALGTSQPTALVIPNTDRPLSSSPDDTYMVSFWVRPFLDLGNGTLISTIDADGGLEVTLSGNVVQVHVQDGAVNAGTEFNIAIDTWTSIALRTTGRGKGLEIWLNGNFLRGIATPDQAGFGTKQARNLEVGPFNNVDVDDLRFYNTMFVDTQMCTAVARGSVGGNGCLALSPGFELDFENNRFVETGVWKLGVAQPQLSSFLRGFAKTGDALRINENVSWGLSGFATQAPFAPGHSFSLWFNADLGAAPTSLIDFTRTCQSPKPCGIRLTWNTAGKIDVFVGSDSAFDQTVTVGVAPGRMNNVVVTERRSGNKTISISIYINGKLESVVSPTAGDVFSQVNNFVTLAGHVQSIVDEYEFWTEDLEKDPDMLCENGFDGELNPVDGSCLLTSN